MKDGLDNIDEIFKQAFDGFESNVDPSVWNNVQNSIGSGSGGSSTPQIDPTTATSFVGKAMALKIVAGVIAIGTIATGTYLVIDNLSTENKDAIAENVIVEDDFNEAEEEVVSPIVQDNTENESIDITDEEFHEEVVKVSVTNDNPKKGSTGEEKQGGLIGAEPDNNDSSNGDNKNDKSEASEKNGSLGVKADEKLTKESRKSSEAKAVSKLSVKINVDVIKGKAPLTVQFDALGNGIQYFWDFSDGAGELGDAPVHIFPKEGTYTVSLKGIDKDGNYKEDRITIIVEKDYTSSLQRLPNIFSPNGDGVNDIIKIKGKNIEKVQVQISDNKGNPVYYMNSLDDVWDGRNMSGDILPQGQYYMIVLAWGEDGKKHVKKSAINLRE